jgi:hypothetical protein
MLRARFAAGRRGAFVLAAIAGLALAGQPARADAGWFESGDTLLRMDLQLLNDAQVIRVPINQWPLPREAVRYALANAKSHFATNAAVAAALDRVRARLSEGQTRGARPLGFEVQAVAGEAGLFRDFDTLGREDAELNARADYATDRMAFTFKIAGVADPADDESVRLDGSNASVQFGNWLLSANTLDRWWGPAHESSLILSSNARPMPTIVVERASARAFETPWLSWLGPWRFSFGISRMESEREDIDAPLFMAWRVVVMPFRDIEIGFSRTAQFCGEQLECDLDTFFDMLIGNDNIGFDATPESEPGNQMAGFDLRWNSPIGTWPYAIYSQYIGEDESSYVPAKYLAQLGLEAWKPMPDGGLLQGFIEYASTTCSANTGRGPYYNCAYNQGRFNVEGYRYFGRSVGHTSDNDAENYALGVTYATPGGELWSATARTSRLNRDGLDARNTVSANTSDYTALELGWKGTLYGQHVAVDLGVEALEPWGGDRDVSPFGFVSWRYEFQQ